MENHSSHRILISCEHALNWVPDDYQDLFKEADEVLSSHRGWDPGALIIAHTIKELLHAPIFIYPFTRLLIEPNRSLHHSNLFSEYTKHLPAQTKETLIDRYYRPYRQSVESYVSSLLLNNHLVIHLSIHTFTPYLNGSERNVDVGLLYDPSRQAEKLLCNRLKYTLNKEISTLRTRMNQPYKGISDGFTKTLRQQFGESYIGIELEVNQKYFFYGGDHLNRLSGAIAGSLLHM